MVRIYFVRHAQPDFSHYTDLTRPLTEEGKKDTEAVTEFFKDKEIDVFYCSPYKRSIDTIKGDILISKTEHLHIEKEFKAKER